VTLRFAAGVALCFDGAVLLGAVLTGADKYPLFVAMCGVLMILVGLERVATDE
jgi:hypothetical protein